MQKAIGIGQTTVNLYTTQVYAYVTDPSFFSIVKETLTRVARRPGWDVEYVEHGGARHGLRHGAIYVPPQGDAVPVTQMEVVGDAEHLRVLLSRMHDESDLRGTEPPDQLYMPVSRDYALVFEDEQPVGVGIYVSHITV